MLATTTHAWAKIILPDACGEDKIKFDVKSQKNAPAPALPAEGKAQIIFIAMDSLTVRFGIDGNWVGAAKHGSYFAAEVTPGVHHLCSGVQVFEIGSARTVEGLARMASFTAEAGKVYYVAYSLSGGGGTSGTPPSTTVVPGATAMGGGPVVVTQSGTPGTAGAPLSSGLSFLNEDEGKYRVKAFPRSIFTVQPWYGAPQHK